MSEVQAPVSARAAKILRFDLDSKRSTVKNQFSTMEQELNEALQDLAKNGHKVISILASPFSDTTADYLIYTIIYE